MEPISSPKPKLSDEARRILRDVARQSIAHGVERGGPLQISLEEYPPELQEIRACFVTLHLGGMLRGCIGSLEAHRPLVLDVAHMAFSAAFSDPRFSPVRKEELEDLEISISVLSPQEQISFDSEEDLLQKIRPGIDGLVIKEDFFSGTLLPSVWESIPDPKEFLRTLKMKANLPPNHWSDTVQIFRYTTESFS